MTNPLSRIGTFVLLALTASLSGCGSPGGQGSTPSADGSTPMRVVTTTGMIADIAQNVGGDRVQAQALMGPGVDPHLYKATPGDLRKLNEAQIIFYNGLHL